MYNFVKIDYFNCEMRKGQELNESIRYLVSPFRRRLFRSPDSAHTEFIGSGTASADRINGGVCLMLPPFPLMIGHKDVIVGIRCDTKIIERLFEFDGIPKPWST